MSSREMSTDEAVTGGGAAGKILSQLEQVEEEVLQQQESWEGQLHQLQVELEKQRGAARNLEQKLSETERQAELEQQRANAFRERTLRLSELLKQVHRTLFGGNVYELILQASLTMSGASRGMYITWRTGAESPVVRASEGIEGDVGSPPSPLIEALCSRVLESRDTLVCNDLNGEKDLPPAGPSEHFRNCAIIPVLLQQDFDGVVVVADKKDGEFTEEDLDTLLSIGGQASVALENISLQRELQESYVSTITVLADAIEAKDAYTHGHCVEASRLAQMTAERLGFSPEECTVICYAALLHDVGKIGISDGILNKPGPLLPEEREVARAHVRVGHDLIGNVEVLRPVAEAVLHHHEWFDGSGYPDGLEGDQIPIASRIISVVDAYGAMTSRRAYKEAYDQQTARDELRSHAGSQFDPQVVETFLQVLDSVEGTDLTSEMLGCGLLPGFGPIREHRQGT